MRRREMEKAKIYEDEWKGGGEERMEGIFEKVLNLPALRFHLRRMDEKVLTLYFIRGCPDEFSNMEKILSSRFHFWLSTTYHDIAW